jgi:hypothetical protein
MAKIEVIQTSFAGGEFGPDLYGRSDVASYQNACEIVENFLVRSYGPAISAPGTTYIGAVSTSTLKNRLIKFVFNRADAYVINMAPVSFRFYTNGGIVVTTGTTPYQLAHVYTESEINAVQYAQLNDVMWLTHKSHQQQKLIRKSAASWSIGDFQFKGGPFLDTFTVTTGSDGITTSTTIKLTASATAGTVNITVSPTNSNLFTVSTSTLGHQGVYWMIGGLSQTNATTGLQEVGYVKLTNVINSYTATATVIKNLKSTVATDNWAEGAWSSVRGYPASVILHERRLWFARTNHEPTKVWGSKVFEYDNFALDEQEDDDALNLELASNEANEIQWLASGKSLIAGTYGGAFVINSGGSDPITPTTVQAKDEIGYGVSALAPKRIGNFLYYIQRFGKKLRELFYFWDLDTYKAIDRTILSPHILGDSAIEMDAQQNPDTILYCVRTDGTMACMTREVDQDVTAWSRIVTDGTFTSIAVIPSQTNLYDEAWVIVERWINGVQKKYVELFDSIEPPARQDLCNYLHSSLRYNAFTSGSSATTTITLSATSGTSVTVTASGPAFLGSHVGKRLRVIDGAGMTLGEGKITATVTTSQCTIAVSLTFTTTAFAVNRWGISVSAVSGLDHLEAETVSVLADGGTDKPNKTVSAGSITLSYNYFVVNVGLPYDQIIRTLPPEAGSQRGTAQGKKQKISEVAFKVYRSHKGFKYGGKFAWDNDNMDVAGSRDPSTLMGTPEALYSGIIPNLSFQDDYQYGSRVYIKNSDPLPLELLNIIPTIDTQDK